MGWDWRPLDQNEANSTASRLVKPVFAPAFESDDFCPGISVDWKSLTIPASLPITTDYFPDDKSLDTDYVVAIYSLLPDDDNAEYWMRPPEDKNVAFYRRAPLTTAEVFRELVSQRLGQGFQWILTKKPQKTEVAPSSTALQPQYQHTKGLNRARHHSEPEEEYYLSIGRIFHKVKLKGATITVTRYWPRHPQPQRHIVYHYRFQVPDSECYEASSTEFRNELLETYNWNYLDQYICTRGEADYGLVENLKFWRSRFFLLPTFNTATKKIIDGQTTRCDIYEEKSPAEFKQLITGFLRFVEILNKLKKSPQARRSKVGAETDSSPGKPDQDSKEKEEKLTTSSPLTKIADAMLDTNAGLSFIQSQMGLPGNCFISAEGAMWVQQHVSGAAPLSAAIRVMKSLLDEGLILHASGNANHKFIFGFYLYYFSYPKAKSEPHVVYPGSSYNTLFQNEWLEVSILPSPALEEGEGEQTAATEGGKFFLPTSKDSPERIIAAPPGAFSSITVTDDWRNQTCWSKQGWGQQSGLSVGSPIPPGLYVGSPIPPGLSVGSPIPPGLCGFPDPTRALWVPRSHQDSLWVPRSLPPGLSVGSRIPTTRALCGFPDPYHQSSLWVPGSLPPGFSVGSRIPTTRAVCGFPDPTRALCGFSDPTRAVCGFPDPTRALCGFSDPTRALCGFPDPTRAICGFPDPTRAVCGFPDPTRALCGFPDTTRAASTLLHKYVNVDGNPSRKSERQEWASACYHANYSPLCAFELHIQWMVATGSLLGDMIYSWARKATTCGFHLIPVPGDPFALPNCVNSDPLRGPIFIPLNINLEEGVFKDCSEDVRQERLHIVQDALLKRFGFMPCSVRQQGAEGYSPPLPTSCSNTETEVDYKYQTPSKYSSSPTTSTANPHMGKRSSSDLHKDYIARQQSSHLRVDLTQGVGFLWSWNFMSTKRWRSSNTGYEDFQDKLLADFRRFCSRGDDRLEELVQDVGFPS
ncbi:hypothetical protein ACOMHN_038238 [Nucella lapillus]